MVGTAAALDVVHQLLVGARIWSAGGTVDLDRLALDRADLLSRNHRRHLAEVPAYARLASDLDVAADGTLDGEPFLISDEWFKGYDTRWPDTDLAALTAWLAEVSTVRPDHPAGATDLASWRAALRADEVYVTFSSGTGGAPSLVPRDRMTLTALRSGSGVRLPWALPQDRFDALLLTPRGMGSGIQGGAAGMARLARRSTHDDDPDWPALLDGARADTQPVIVYGTPARLSRLLPRLGDGAHLAPGSCVVTGGGWKGEAAGDVFTLLDTASDAFGVPRSRCVDTYSTAELNTVIVSCVENRYHVPPVLEALVVDEALRPVHGDADGRVAFVEPMAMSYPGRLMTSDVVRVRRDRCPCGLVGQTLLPPITRMPGAAPRGCGLGDGVVP